MTASLSLTLLLGVLIALTPLGTDSYLPALPVIALELGASIHAAQFTVTAFFLGLAFGQFGWGPLSDRFGRRPALFGGLALAALASLIGVAAQAVDTLVWVRLVQGIGLSSGPVVARSIVRDLYGREQAAQLLARMTIVFSLAPISAPLIGAGLLAIGWQAVFAAIALVAIALIGAIVRTLPETSPRPVPRDDTLLRTYGRILREPRFVAPFLTMTASFAGIFGFVSGSAFVLVSGFGVSPTAFALLFATVMLGQMLGAWISARAVVQIGVSGMLRAGAALAAASGVLFALLAFSGLTHWVIVVGPMMLYMAATSLIIPNATAAALNPFPATAGAASSLIGTTQFLLGSAISAGLGAAFDGSARPLALVVLAGGCLAFFLERTLRHHIAPTT